MNNTRIENLLGGIALGEFRSIVPAFFVIDAPADAADEAASACAEDLNQSIRDVAHPNAARVRLFLCEGSKTSEIPAGADVPNTLAGFTCDALPRVEAAAALALIRDIALNPAGGNSEPDVMARAIDDIIGKAQGFIGSAAQRGTVLHRLIIAGGAETTELIDQLAAALDSCLAHFGPQMTDADRRSRETLVQSARKEVDLAIEDAAAAEGFGLVLGDLARGQFDVHVTGVEPVETVPGTITLSFTVDDQFCADVMCAALEGGIGYWAAASDIVKKASSDPALTVSDYVSCTLHPEEDDEFVPATLDYDSIRVGIARVLGPDFSISGLIRDAIARGVANNDAGEIDADAADCIVQAAFFGEITYG